LVPDVNRLSRSGPVWNNCFTWLIRRDWLYHNVVKIYCIFIYLHNSYVMKRLVILRFPFFSLVYSLVLFIRYCIRYWFQFLLYNIALFKTNDWYFPFILLLFAEFFISHYSFRCVSFFFKKIKTHCIYKR